jgi:cytochrome c biogenesis protein CcdA
VTSLPGVTALVASIAIADSANPATIGPALYLAAKERPRRQLTEFAVGFFGVNLAGGILVLLGPGQLLLAILPRPGSTAERVIELVVGLALIGLAIAILAAPERLARLGTDRAGERGLRPWGLGAAIAAAELPTALPYFGAIAAILGSGVGLGQQIALVALFNVLFVLPVLIMLVALTLAGAKAERRIESLRDWLQPRFPRIFAALALLAGTALTTIGLSGLLTQ